MQVELDLVKELLMVYDSVKQGYIESSNLSADLNLKDAMARLEVLINILNLVDKLSTPIQFRTEAVEWKLICTYIV